MSRLARVLAPALMLLAVGLPAEEAPRLGQPQSDAEVAALDYVVMPDGAGLPAGGGNASEGAAVYAQHCLACHGENGRDGINDALAGGLDSIRSPQPRKTVGSYWPFATTLFDYIRRAMPYQAPGSLTPGEVYAVTAYILHMNGIVAESERLDAESLPAVEMPNRDNFVWAYEPRPRDPETQK